MSRNIRSLSGRKGLDANLFARLNEAARTSGTPGAEDLERIAADSHLTPAVTFATASFYDFLSQSNAGRRAHACRGTACLVSGRLADGEDGGEAMCVGYCYAGGGLMRTDAEGRHSSHGFADGRPGQPAMPVYSFAATPILTGPVASAEDLYIAGLTEHERIASELEASNLRGRGGAGFPFAFKLKACAASKGDEKYIVCNADEGDPGAFSDRYLLEQQPHKVMAGMYAAALAAGADTAILYIRREYPEAISACRKAIADYERLPGDVADKVGFHIIEGAGSYVCGEETALLNSIEGLRPEVRTRPPYPAQAGLWGKPTVVSNVETFANIPWILHNGGAAFAAIGTDKSKGTKLVSLDVTFARPGLYEIDFGTPFKALVEDMAGGFSREVKALQVGGPLGSIVPLERIGDLTLSFEDFQQAGFALGHAGIIAIPADFPMIDLLRHLFRYMAHESCGKCTPCRVGTHKGARLLEKATPQHPADHALFLELLDLLETGSLCALGGGLPLPARNALTHFRAELEPHFSAWKANA